MHDKLNIALLTVDTLRADHLGCYGYPRPTSPFLDAFAQTGALAERFFAPAIPTHPSYTTLLTGQFPTTHNIVAHGGRAELAREAPNLAEQFLQAGYATCSVDNLWRQRFWFGRGFEFIIDPSTRHELLLAVTCEELNHRAIPWLREHRDEPFFLFMHYWDPHYPYTPPERYRHLFYEGNPVDPRNHSLDEWWEHPIGAMARETWLRTPQGVVTDAAYVSAMYDQEIRHLDDGLRDLVGAIDELGLAEQTLVVVVADHGESMTEHGVFFSHLGLHDPVLHVPVLLRQPGRVPGGLRLPQMLQHVDLAPTLLEAAGLPIPRAMEGRSFWGLATGASREGGYAEVLSLECTWQASWSLRTERYKLILGREADEAGAYPRELYDLLADPREERNLVAERPELAARLEARLEELVAERLRRAGRAQDPLREQGISMGLMLHEEVEA